MLVKPAAFVRDGFHLCLRDPVWIKRLKEANTYSNPAFEAATKYGPFGASPYCPPTLEYYDQDEDLNLVVGRGFNAHRFSAVELKELMALRRHDYRQTAPVQMPPLLVEPTPQQEELLERALSAKRPLGNYLFLASTAVGKTILQIMLAHHFGQRTLVVCPTDLIIRAWQDDLRKTLALKLPDIGLLKASKWRLGEHFTIASLQTLGRRRKFWSKLHSAFGCVIFDEAQGLSSRTAYQFAWSCTEKYLIGATATESATGEPNGAVRALLGSPVAVLRVDNRETATSMPISTVRVVETEFHYHGSKELLDYHDLTNCLLEDEDRNQLIVANVIKDWTSGRSVLLVTKRTAHVSLLHTMLMEAGINDANCLTGDTNTDRFYTDRLLKAVAREKVTCLVATMAAVKMGANIPRLDCLHIGMPPASTGNLEQLLGRIRRKSKFKTSADVTYYLDIRVSYLTSIYRRIAVSTFRRMAIKGYQNLYVT